MTYQNDPNRPDRDPTLGREPARNFGRRADGSWNILPPPFPTAYKFGPALSSEAISAFSSC
jgi:hypothetical protein